MIGLDYADFGNGGVETRTVNRVAIDYSRNGGLVTISTHLYNPANPQGGGLRDQGVDLESIITPGSETYTRWMQELDALADGLKELQDADVVVLWRPFHEMNGGWFWWGAKDPAVFIRVWRHMFDYFTKTKGLNNLLWVYGPNHGSKTAAYYAGDQYVDMVGLDAYTDFVDPQHIRGYDDVVRLPASPGAGAPVRVLTVDRFGNVILDLPRAALPEPDLARLRVVTAGGAVLDRLLRTYGDAADDTPFLLFNSSDHLEIAVRCGRADRALGVAAGDEVRIDLRP